MFFSSPPWDSVVYWALDLETGGLDAKRDPIIAVGMLPIRAARVRLGEVDRRIAEGVLLVHHKAIDVAFLKDAYRHCGLKWPSPPVVDTVDLLVKLARKAHLARPELPADPAALNLSAAREAHGLPPYQAHDALADALATGELFLVLRNALRARTLRDLR